MECKKCQLSDADIRKHGHCWRCHGPVTVDDNGYGKCGCSVQFKDEE